jgi:secreted trypsin-like serine protease
VSFKGAYGYRDIAVVFSHAGRGTTGGTCFGDSGGPTFDISTPALADENIIVAVTSFGLNYNCNASGSYRIDQPEDLAFLADPAGADYE